MHIVYVLHSEHSETSKAERPGSWFWFFGRQDGVGDAESRLGQAVFPSRLGSPLPGSYGFEFRCFQH